jgi:hypothetical protein
MKKNIRKINHTAAGIDIGASQIFIALENKPVVSFSTFTENYVQAIEYLKENKITTVAMEATGVYWFALYEMIEQAGIEVYLVNGRAMRNVPGLVKAMYKIVSGCKNFIATDFFADVLFRTTLLDNFELIPA